MKYKVDTAFNEYTIEQVTSFTGSDGLREEVSRGVINLQEAGVREALIKLGWTPPKED